MMNYPFASARIFGVPLALHPQKGKIIAQALADRMGLGQINVDGLRPMAGDWFDDDDGVNEADADKGFDLVRGAAVINITGTLVHRSSSLRPSCGMLGYNAIRTAYLSALEDDEAKAIVLLCNSHGGEVSGCFDLVDTIFDSRGAKPITAICDDMAFSACYAIASAADTIVLPRTGGVGSVGVITMHADYSQALKGQGVAVSIFHHGDRKASGNPYNPLSKVDRQEIQADIDALGDLFVNTVARNRGLIPAQVRDTQARCYMGAAGVDVGLADAVMAPDEAFRVLAAALG